MPTVWIQTTYRQSMAGPAMLELKKIHGSNTLYNCRAMEHCSNNELTKSYEKNIHPAQFASNL